MFYLSLALFAVTAVFGLVILSKWLTQKDASKGVIYGHGIFAVAAIVALLVYGLKSPGNISTAAIVLLVLSVLGGFYMFINDLRGKMTPLAVAFVHALLAVATVAVLVYPLFA
ncbi:MAG: hypothetical protein K0S09_2377 [Sphingobacteriaceae bacterium]|jgi:hypothetical protein|nr:hypothetical protein [Sphingobacteriaceae bacterium]